MVQCENTAGSTTAISAGNIGLKDGATVLRSSAFAIYLSPSSPNNHKWWVGQAVEVSAPLNVVYTVTVLASQTGMNCESKIFAIAGVTASIVAGSSTACGTSDTTLATLISSGIAAGDNALITTFEMSNTGTPAARSIGAGDLKVKDPGGTAIGNNEFVMNFAGFGTTAGRYQTQLIPLFRVGDGANPTYGATCLASAGASINGLATIALVSLSPAGLAGAGFDGGSTAIGSSATTIGTLNPTNVPSGANVGVIASEQFADISSAVNIGVSANALQQAATSTGQTSNQFQETFPDNGGGEDGKGFALFNLFSAGSDNPSYRTQATASAASNLNGETKILIIRGTGTWSRSASDSYVFSDSPTRNGVSPRSISDSYTFSDLPQRMLQLGLAPADSFSFSDLAGSASSLPRSISDSFPISDLSSNQVLLSRVSSDLYSFAESAVRLVSFDRSAVDSLLLSEFSAGIVALSRGLVDDFGFADSALSNVQFTRAASDPFGFSDLTDRLAKLAGSASDTFSFSDLVARNLQIPTGLWMFLWLLLLLILLLLVLAIYQRRGSKGDSAREGQGNTPRGVLSIYAF